jgi:hypothetical protein
MRYLLHLLIGCCLFIGCKSQETPEQLLIEDLKSPDKRIRMTAAKRLGEPKHGEGK